jgi:hypothetical protein
MPFVVTITERTPTERSDDDIVCHTITASDMLKVASIIEEAEINFTVFVSVVIVRIS